MTRILKNNKKNSELCLTTPIIIKKLLKISSDLSSGIHKIPRLGLRYSCNVTRVEFSMKNPHKTLRWILYGGG